MGILNSRDYCGNCKKLDLASVDDRGRYWCMERNHYYYTSEYACKSKFEARYIITAVCDILKDDKYLNDNGSILKVKSTLFEEFDRVCEEEIKNDKFRGKLESYNIIGPMIADRLREDPFKETIANSMLIDYLMPAAYKSHAGDYEEASSIFEDMTIQLFDFYYKEVSSKKRVMNKLSS